MQIGNKYLKGKNACSVMCLQFKNNTWTRVQNYWESFYIGVALWFTVKAFVSPCLISLFPTYFVYFPKLCGLIYLLKSYFHVCNFLIYFLMLHFPTPKLALMHSPRRPSIHSKTGRASGVGGIQEQWSPNNGQLRRKQLHSQYGQLKKKWLKQAQLTSLDDDSR